MSDILYSMTCAYHGNTIEEDKRLNMFFCTVAGCKECCEIPERTEYDVRKEKELRKKLWELIVESLSGKEQWEGRISTTKIKKIILDF